MVELKRSATRGRGMLRQGTCSALTQAANAQSAAKRWIGKHVAGSRPEQSGHSVVPVQLQDGMLERQVHDSSEDDDVLEIKWSREHQHTITWEDDIVATLDVRASNIQTHYPVALPALYAFAEWSHLLSGPSSTLGRARGASWTRARAISTHSLGRCSSTGRRRF